MSSSKRQAIFVLWGEHFDELATVTFVARLRAAGLLVKVTGISRRAAPGACGLSLLPDLTVEEARKLADSMLAVVIACGRLGAQALMNDPRLYPFLQEACERCVPIFCTSIVLEVLGAVNMAFRDACHVTLLPPDEHLLSFVDKVCQPLIANTKFDATG